MQGIKEGLTLLFLLQVWTTTPTTMAVMLKALSVVALSNTLNVERQLT